MFYWNFVFPLLAVGSRGSGDVDVVNSRNDHVNDLIDPDEDEELNTASSLSPPLRPSSEVRGSSGTKRGHSDDDTDSGAHVNGTTNGSPVKKAAKRTMESLNAMAGANIKIASRSKYSKWNSGPVASSKPAKGLLWTVIVTFANVSQNLLFR